jgi:hypothetical protein
MKVPGYVWKAALVLLTIREIRLWYDTVKSYEEDDDEKEKVPDCCKHLYA